MKKCINNAETTKGGTDCTNSKHLWFLKTCWPNSFSKFFIVVVDNISNWQFTVFPDERIVIKITGFESCFDGF